MTRGEAIKIMVDDKWFGPTEVSGRWIDIFAALGMLELDEPKSANEKALEVLKGKNLPRGPYNVFVLGPNEAGAIIDALHAAGLKIVEK